MLLSSSHAVLPYIGIAFAIAAGAHDVAARTIPHWAVAGIATSGFLLHIGDGGLAGSLGGAALTFSLACVLWRAGWMGGGDAKLLGAVALVLPPTSILSAIVTTSITGALLALPYVVLRGRLGSPNPGGRSLSVLARTWRAERFRLNRGGPLPYGVAISLGAILTLWSNGV